MRILFWLLFIVFTTTLSAQMEVDGQILYGNEWIDYNKTYIKISVDEDGIYRVTRAELLASGMPLEQISLKNVVIYNYGKSIAFFADPNDDYIEFFGVRNRSELDQFIYLDKASVLNPEYSVVSNESAYFLTWDETINPLLISQVNTDLSSNSLQPQTYYNHNEMVVQNEIHYKPTEDSEQVRYSNFVPSEGYGSGLNSKNSLNVPISNVVNNGVGAKVKVRFGGNRTTHRTIVSINDIQKDTITHYVNQVVQKEYTIGNNELGNSNLKLELKGVASDSDKNILANVEVTYPREFDMNGDTSFMFHVRASSVERYFEVDGYEISDIPIIYDLEDNIRIIPEITPQNKIGFLLPSSSIDKRIFIASSQHAIKKPTATKLREFIDYNNPDYNYIILSSEDIRNQDNIDWVQEYSDYRASEIGGSYVPVIANVDQLYDQYAYGIDRHFIAFRNFGYWTKENYTKPEFMFIIGKGREYRENRSADQIENNIDAYVPTWGNPGSDNMILSSDTLPLPIYPIGRLAAKSAQEVGEYLDKVKEHDLNLNLPQTIDDRQWQKRVLHLSGGDATLQEILANNLQVMGDSLTNNMFGADVTTFYKKSVEAIEVATSDQIFELINNGLSIITFFGHSSVGKFDFNIDNIDKYENKGKYPLVLSLGCYSGNIHTDSEGISEEFVVRKDKGAICFIAASGTAYVGQQYQYGLRYYERLGGEDYGKPLGTVLNNVIEEFASNASYSYITFLQQLTLHGDPAIRLPSYETPDFIPDMSTVKTNPKFIDTYDENFEICLDVANIGKSLKDSFSIQVIHQNPIGEIEYELEKKFATPSYSENYCFTIPITSKDLVGKNKVLVHVDHQDVVVELPGPQAETNNFLRNNNNTEGYEFFILNNSAIPTHPEEFAIVTTEKVNLIANTYNALGELQTFYVELDTTMNFDSPSLKKKTFNNIRSVLNWDLDNSLINETVYFWRVGSENTASGDTVWRESSFIYEPGQREGWNQSHYFQFLKDDFSNLEYDSLRQLKFVDNVKEIVMDNGPIVEFRINSSIWSKWKRNVNYGVAVVLFDPVIGSSDRNWGGDPQYGSVNTNIPEGSWTHYFEFPTSTVQERENLINVLRDSIPEGYVVSVSFVEKPNQEYNLEEWAADTTAIGTSLIKLFESEGALRLNELQSIGSVPYIFSYLKGKKKVLAEVVATEEDEQIKALFQIKTLWDRGDLTGTTIGPATAWDEVVWNSEISELDSVKIDVIGIRMDNSEEMLFDDITSNSIDLSTVDTDEFPFLKLKYFTSDVALSAAQLQMLRVYYEGITDLSVNSDSHFVFHKAKIDEGDEFRIEIDVSNVSNKDADPTTIVYSIIDEQNNQTNVEQDIKALKTGESVRDVFKLNTKGISGVNTIQMQLNPLANPMEKNYFNNFGLYEIEVKPDTVNPLLNVTFDGIQIMNEDIVSAQPLIRIELDDGNPYLLLEDRDNFVVLLTDPNGNQEQIQLDGPDINFIPAESKENNVAVIEYTPKLDDGRYLLTVQGSDVSANVSGNLDYEIYFRVYNKEMVSNVFNYPNPFSTSTQFIFTLTGDEEPGNVLIRIMTLTGKMVREITSAELGNLRIGMNKTEMKWDGTDEYGDKLGNGTYLYQVITKKIDGSDYDHFSDPTQNNTDHLFKKGFGKLVIMR